MANPGERDGVFQRKDRHGWFVSYINAAGKRRKRKVTAHTRKQALDALSAIKTQVEREKILGVKEPSEISTEELLARYSRYQKSRLRSSTFERLQGILRTLKANLPRRAKDISRNTIADYISERARSEISHQGPSKRGVAPGTIHKEIAVLKHALKLAVEWDLLNNNPAQGAKLPKLPQGRTRYLSPVELKTALRAAPDWIRRPIALAAFTGMQRGELLALRWGDVDLENRRLYLRETKNGTLRIVVLSDLALQVLNSIPQGQHSDYLLPGIDGQKLSVYTRRLFKRVSIEGASFHSLRHTALAGS